MKRIAHRVTVHLVFDGLSLAEAAALETFIEGGFDQNTEWGAPQVSFEMVATGLKDIKTDKKAMTAKKVLELEKEGAGKK